MASGKLDQIKGTGKSVAGAATNNRSLQVKGEAQKLKGAAKEKLRAKKKAR